MGEQHQKKISAEFRAFMAGELRDPAITRAKKDFLNAHFSRPARGAGVLRWVIPALSLVLVFVLAAYFDLFPRDKTGRPVPVPVPVSAGSGLPDTLAVFATRVSSQTGSPLIYQKTVEGIPVTVIWVF